MKTLSHRLIDLKCEDSSKLNFFFYIHTYSKYDLEKGKKNSNWNYLKIMRLIFPFKSWNTNLNDI